MDGGGWDRADELRAENARLRKALQDALNHSSCYCEVCKALSDLYWMPEEDPKAVQG